MRNVELKVSILEVDGLTLFHLQTFVDLHQGPMG